MPILAGVFRAFDKMLSGRKYDILNEVIYGGNER
jgi:hypothetical protein